MGLNIEISDRIGSGCMVVRYAGPKGLGLWLQKTHRSMRRTEQELEIRALLESLGLEFEEQYPIMLGSNEGRPGVKLEEGVSWVVVDFFIRVNGEDYVLECARLTRGTDRQHMMRARQRAAFFEVRFFEIKRRYDMECIALIEAPEPNLADYLRPRIPHADFVVDSIDSLREILIGLANRRAQH